MGNVLNSLCCAVLSRFSCVQLFVILWTVAHQVLLSTGFSRQEHWSRLPALFQGIFLTQGWNLYLLCLLHCKHILKPLSHLRSPLNSLVQDKGIGRILTFKKKKNGVVIYILIPWDFQIFQREYSRLQIEMNDHFLYLS